MARQQERRRRAVGLDFGTTNSALAVAQADGRVQLATIREAEETHATFRSVLYFAHPDEETYAEARVVAGPQAIQRYLDAEPQGRFLQSIKSFLASRQFERTRVFTRSYTLEELIALLLRAQHVIL
ncbi:MAG: hypothetical protein AB7N91_01870 [Candidatus Tectimicrobiota bacterium]